MRSARRHDGPLVPARGGGRAGHGGGLPAHGRATLPGGQRAWRDRRGQARPAATSPPRTRACSSSWPTARRWRSSTRASTSASCSVAETLQRTLLPERLPRIPGHRAGRALPAGRAQVGGDWYDAIPLEGERVGLAMGDVVGQGLAAASVMGMLRNSLRAYALDGHGPAAVLERLDRLVDLERDGMATLVYLEIEPDLTSMRVASAGHLPPLVIAPDGADVVPGRPRLGTPRSRPGRLRGHRRQHGARARRSCCSPTVWSRSAASRSRWAWSGCAGRWSTAGTIRRRCATSCCGRWAARTAPTTT